MVSPEFPCQVMTFPGESRPLRGLGWILFKPEGAVFTYERTQAIVSRPSGPGRHVGELGCHTAFDALSPEDLVGMNGWCGVSAGYAHCVWYVHGTLHTGFAGPLLRCPRSKVTLFERPCLSSSARYSSADFAGFLRLARCRVAASTTSSGKLS